MIANLLQEDKHLKIVTQKPKDQKPRFEWSALSVAVAEGAVPASIKVNIGGSERDFDSAEIADTVGSALTDLFWPARRRRATSTRRKTASWCRPSRAR